MLTGAAADNEISVDMGKWEMFNVSNGRWFLKAATVSHTTVTLTPPRYQRCCDRHQVSGVESVDSNLNACCIAL